MGAEPPLELRMAAWMAVVSHADRQAPDECCGLLIGETDRIETAWAAKNLADTPRTRYQVDPRDHFAALRDARTQGLTVVGAYHSHPRSAPWPSPTDRANAIADFIYLIVGRTPDAAWTPRVFWLVDGNFMERIFVFEA